MKEDLHYEIAMKQPEGHWILSTVLWSHDNVGELTMDEYVILREFDMGKLKRYGKVHTNKEKENN